MNEALNTVWSQMIQTPLTLDYHRRLRFREERKVEILQAFDLKPNSITADIGCGPGTLSLKLAQWLGPSSTIIGVDRDLNFIEFAKHRALETGATNLHYQTGDALNLPMADNSVEQVISYTVVEHLPHEPFFKEQIRICKNGGRIAAGYVRIDKNLNYSSGLLPAPTEREKELWRKISIDCVKTDKALQVGEFQPQEEQLLALFSRLGMQDIHLNILALPVCLADSRFSETERRDLRQQELAQQLEVIEILQNQRGLLSYSEFTELNSLVKNRLSIKSNHNPAWDFNVSFNIVITGQVNK